MIGFKKLFLMLAGWGAPSGGASPGNNDYNQSDYKPGDYN